MFVLDTCFVSEFTRKTPDPGVIAWLDQQVPSDLLITTLTLGEIAKGIERLPMRQKRPCRTRRIPHTDTRIRPVGTKSEIVVSLKE